MSGLGSALRSQQTMSPNAPVARFGNQCPSHSRAPLVGREVHAWASLFPVPTEARSSEKRPLYAARPNILAMTSSRSGTLPASGRADTVRIAAAQGLRFGVASPTPIDNGAWRDDTRGD